MNRQIPSDFSQRVKDLRLRANLTQAGFAELVGVTPVTVYNWETGRARPSWKRWQQILRAEALGLHGLTASYDPQRVMREPDLPHEATPPPTIDFSAEPEVVRLVVQGHRLAYGHLANPTFATETAQIEPLPHQRIAVYERMLNQPRLRFLLADDAGAGKTIMAGLYIREMLSRRLIERVLIVPPAGLVGNWESELRTLFGLSFRVVVGSDARLSNPFSGPDGDLVIVSVDTLAGERAFTRLQEPAVLPYDLVVFDEAHKLSARWDPNLRITKTQRYFLAEALAGISEGDARWELGWSCRHLLLMTATPHMGKDFPYYCLWRLLEPEALSTFDAFKAFPLRERRRHFIRRSKEEMVDYAGKAIYPRRVSDTLSYGLTQGQVSEQRLYDETTQYISTYYNRALVLNRSAVRLAMSVFQRRLASSTYALLRSLENRLRKLEAFVDDIHSGKLSLADLAKRQSALDEEAHSVLDETTADEEESAGEVEQNEAADDQTLGSFAFRTLIDLEVELQELRRLRDLARQVYGDGSREDSKFARLLEAIRDPHYRGEKLIIFTEHRDTMAFLVRRLEQLGYTGEVAQIHGGMAYREREAQIEYFRKPVSEGGARYLVATDAAGEGINLQFCWLMVNYDVPWNPARLEQRMGRIHRYGQKHDPVLIMNLVAAQTREGKVIKTLLDKMEVTAKQLGRDRVFDVVGKLFEGTSLTAYMERALTAAGAEAASQDIAERITESRVKEQEAQEKLLFGEEEALRHELPRLQANRSQDQFRKLLPGQVRWFIQGAAPLLGIGIEGALESYFSLRSLKPGSLDPLWPVLEGYPPDRRRRLTLFPDRAGKEDNAVFVRPGDVLFERLVACFLGRFAEQALRGCVFVDPTAQESYLLHLVRIDVARRAALGIRALARREMLESRIVSLRQDPAGNVEAAPVEQLLLLRGGAGIYGPHVQLAARAQDLRDGAWTHAVDHVARPLADKHRQALLDSLPERSEFLMRGYDYQEAELAETRARLREKAEACDRRAAGELSRVKKRQQALAVRREAALNALRSEPELIEPSSIAFLAHALVIPSADPEDMKRYDAAVEAIAVREARAHEEARGAVVTDVSTPELARAAGLEDYPGFDLLSRHLDGEERMIEVKGRALVGDVELSENEWIRSCTHQKAYWLYVVYHCATAQPQLWRVQNPFSTLVARLKGAVLIGESEILTAAEPDG